MDFFKKIARIGMFICLISILFACGGDTEQDAADVEKATEEETRIYTDDLGREVEVPENPERVIALNFAADMVALGTIPVGMYDYLRLDIYKDKLTEIESVGEFEPNLEKVLSLKPDLIVGVDYAIAAEQIEELEKIAPVVVIKFGNVMENFHKIAELLNKEDAEKEWLATYEKKVNAVREELLPTIEAGETATSFYMYQKNIRLTNTQTFHVLYDVLGFVPSEMMKKGEEGVYENSMISMEAFSEAKSDRLFFVDDSPSQQVSQDIKKMYSDLPAFHNDKVYLLDSAWYYGQDVLAVDWQLDHIAEIFKK